MNTLYKYLALVIVGLLLTPMTSCSDDDDVINTNADSQYSMIGEWYTDIGTPITGVKNQYISEYYNDGTWSGMLSNATISSNYNIPVEGTYKITGKKMVQTTVLLEEQSTATYDIISIGKYDLRLYYPETQIEDFSHRIVDTYHLQVGQTDYIQINDPDFFPKDYISNDDEVVKVSLTGTIQAVRAGSAYISVLTDIGTAVIRVLVTDPETYIDNYVNYLGESYQKATEAYGNLYSDIDDGDGTFRRRFFLIDDLVDIIDFSYETVNNHIQSIALHLRENVNLYQLFTAFSNRYEYLGYEDSDGYYYFRTMKTMRIARVSFNPTTRIVEVFYNDLNDPIAQMDELIRMTASEAAKTIGHVITQEERAEGKFIEVVYNPVFRGLSIRFDENDEIRQMVLYCKSDVSASELELWYRLNYTYTGEIGKYGQINPLMIINLGDGEEGNGHVIYTK